MEAIGFRTVRIIPLLKSSSQFARLTTISSATNSRTFSSTEKSEQSETAEQATTELEKKLLTDVDALQNQVNKLTETNDELLDKYKRSLADGENLRVRLTKQIQDAKLFGIQSFCKDLLEVADTLGHATKAVPKEQIDSNPHLKNLYDGLILTKNSLEQVFKRHGLEQVNPINEKFNPNFHEALFQKECKDAAPDTVVEVTKIGYKLHERCIRPALVGVSRQ